MRDQKGSRSKGDAKSRDGRKVTKPGKGGKVLRDGSLHHDKLTGQEDFPAALDEGDPNYEQESLKPKNPSKESTMLALPSFFAKPDRLDVKVSPRGHWLAYQGRDANGILNLWLVDLQAVERSGVPLGAESGRQLTWAEDRDVCRLYRFANERYIVYLRETGGGGNEFYHLFRLDLQAKNPWESCTDLIQDPHTTCCLGFIGGVQLWCNPSTNDVYLSTGKGGPIVNLR